MLCGWSCIYVRALITSRHKIIFTTIIYSTVTASLAVIFWSPSEWRRASHHTDPLIIHSHQALSATFPLSHMRRRPVLMWFVHVCVQQLDYVYIIQRGQLLFYSQNLSEALICFAFQQRCATKTCKTIITVFVFWCLTFCGDVRSFAWGPILSFINSKSHAADRGSFLSVLESCLNLMISELKALGGVLTTS